MRYCIGLQTLMVGITGIVLLHGRLSTGFTNVVRLSPPMVGSTRRPQLSLPRTTTTTTTATSTTHVEALNLYSAVFQPSSMPHLNNRHSAADWLYNVRSIPQSGVLREVRNPVLAVASWALLVSIVQRCLGRCGFQAMAMSMCIPATAHSFLVSALGLLLVFRTNSAYQRFYEGRKIWENILSVSRNFSRMIQLYASEVGSARKQRIINLLAAYPYLLRHHIRPGCLCESDDADIPAPYRLLLQEPSLVTVETRHEGDKVCGGTTRPELAHLSRPRDCFVDRRNLPWSLLDKYSLAKVAKSQNRPLWVCDRIGREIMSIPYGPNFTSRERLSLLGQVEKLTNAVGQCERIHQTAVPLNYARHSLRSLTLWLFTLPFALVKDLGWLTCPVAAVTAWLLFGVYQIGYSIEDPFQGTLRLSILCDAIRRDVIGDGEELRDSAFQTDTMWQSVDDIQNPQTLDAHHGFGKINGHNGHVIQDKVVNGSTLFGRRQSSFAQDMVEKIQYAPPLLIQENGNWNVVGVVKS